MANTAIEYKHFVKTDETPHIPWLGCQLQGKYCIDEGGWRDYALTQERGVEFELKEDADKFIAYFGGEYTTRKVREYNGNISIP